MSHESLLAAAYALVWLLVAAYLVRLARRQRRLEADLRALRSELERSAGDAAAEPAAETGRAGPRVGTI